MKPDEWGILLSLREVSLTTFKSSVDGHGIKPAVRIVKTSTVLCLKPKVIGILITACVVWLSVSNCLKTLLGVPAS